MITSTEQEHLLSVNDVSHVFTRKQGLFSQKKFHALSNISLELFSGKNLGIVGESGSGKSTLARIIAGLMPPTEGSITINGHSLYNAKVHKNYAQFRKNVCRDIQMIFQDPQASLDPRMKVGESIEEPLLCLKKNLTTEERKKRVEELLIHVGLEPKDAYRYPHEFSGGQRQRIAIIRALIIQPKLVICDEPTSSLDPSIQAQVLNVLTKMQETMGVTYLFISHDLSVIRYMSETVAVIFAGTIVEYGPSEKIFKNPVHPYTQLLFSSTLGEKSTKDTPMTTVSHKHENGSSVRGCAFFSRCHLAEPLCGKTIPYIEGLGNHSDHLVRCHKVKTIVG